MSELDQLRARLLERLQAKTRIDATSGCWLWVGSVDRKGYGKINAMRRTFAVHRLGYELLVAQPCSPSQTLDHLCRNRACWNPEHLDPCTNQVNVLRGVGPTAANAVKTHCPQGHELVGDNLRRRPDKPSHWRECATCDRERRRRRGHVHRQPVAG